jgi:hypothetical protein
MAGARPRARDADGLRILRIAVYFFARVR